MRSYAWAPPADKVELFTKEESNPESFKPSTGQRDNAFLAALASMANKPGRVEEKFVSKEITEDGRIVINFNYRGQTVKCTIDDKLPVKSNSDKTLAALTPTSPD